LDTLIVVEVNVVVNDVFGFLEGRDRKLAKRFFLQMSKEVFHRGIIPTIAGSGQDKQLSGPNEPAEHILRQIITRGLEGVAGNCGQNKSHLASIHVFG